MGYQGSQLYPRNSVAASTLERNRFVVLTKSTNTVAYATEAVDGVTTDRSNSTDYRTSWMPLTGMNGTFPIELAGTVAKGGGIQATTDGKAIAASSAPVAYVNEAGVSGDIVEAYVSPAGDLSAENVGTPGTGVVAQEQQVGSWHRTTLTVAGTLPAIAGGANLAVGLLLYTLPAGVQIIRGEYMSLAIQQTDGNITADTPDGGLGSVIASGAVAVLSGTATFEDILTGQTFNDCDGTAEVAQVATNFVTGAAGSKAVYFNVADGWAASGDAAAGLAGTVVLEWVELA